MPLSRRPRIPGEPAYEHWLAVLIPAAWLAAGAMLFVFRVRLPPCLLLKFTAVPCPACGSTRATVALTHGEVWRALYFNPGWTLACLAGVVVWIYSLGVVFGKTRVLRYDTVTPREAWFFRLTLVLAILANWAWNLWRETLSS